MNDSTLLIICIVGAAGFAGWFLVQMLGGEKSSKLRNRLLGRDRADKPVERESGAGAMMPLLQKVSQAAAKPFKPESRESQSALRKKLALAGIYNHSAGNGVAGAKVILLGVGLVGGYLLGMIVDNSFLGLALGGLLGYVAPIMWLKMKISANQQQLTLSLPDALDLMVVCVEAGLTMDAAMQRVGTELSMAHPALSRELGMTHMETRVGLSRAEALKNLGVRTGNSALQSLASMLIQADRFGTSIANALRIHAESLRQQRQHAAEELAAKASVKMSFPLVLFIFPATFIVLAGPTVIQLMDSPIMK